MIVEDPVAAFRSLHTALDRRGWLVFLCWRRMDENPWMTLRTCAVFSVIGPPPTSERDSPAGSLSFGDSNHVGRNWKLRDSITSTLSRPIGMSVSHQTAEQSRCSAKWVRRLLHCRQRATQTAAPLSRPPSRRWHRTWRRTTDSNCRRRPGSSKRRLDLQKFVLPA